MGGISFPYRDGASKSQHLLNSKLLRLDLGSDSIPRAGSNNQNQKASLLFDQRHRIKILKCLGRYEGKHSLFILFPKQKIFKLMSLSFILRTRPDLNESL